MIFARFFFFTFPTLFLLCFLFFSSPSFPLPPTHTHFSYLFFILGYILSPSLVFHDPKQDQDVANKSKHNRGAKKFRLMQLPYVTTSSRAVASLRANHRRDVASIGCGTKLTRQRPSGTNDGRKMPELVDGGGKEGIVVVVKRKLSFFQCLPSLPLLSISPSLPLSLFTICHAPSLPYFFLFPLCLSLSLFPFLSLFASPLSISHPLSLPPLSHD